MGWVAVRIFRLAAIAIGQLAQASLSFAQLSPSLLRFPHLEVWVVVLSCFKTNPKHSSVPALLSFNI